MIAKLIPVAILGVVGWACLAGWSQDQPDPHAGDLARQVAAAFPAGRTKITVATATKTDITFDVLYPSGVNVDGAADGKRLVQAMIRKLLAAGQQPHDQKIRINVWGKATVPGTVGESGHRSDDYDRSIWWSRYEPDGDYIDYEDCGLQPWRLGHCS
jgi:hypothetical protein